MKFTSILQIALLLFMINNAVSQSDHADVVKRTYVTERINIENIPTIDGVLDEEIWKAKNWTTNFIQREPNENAEPSEQTAFKIVYDEHFLYIGIKLFDSKPDKIDSRMSRRDGFEGDWVELVIDSYHDLRSAFSFTLTAAGVKGDKIITMNGANEDKTWNPIWYAKSTINSQGWTAEMKIPLSQLRFGNAERPIWGLQLVRRLFKRQEKSVWQRVPIDASGWVSEFGEIHGLDHIEPQRLLEIQPFFVSSYNTFKKEPENPFKDTYLGDLNAGLDGKIGITNDLTVNFTINPDFGQVEADPAALALDGFQLFFNEQRPFFVENKNIFNYNFSSSKNGGSFSQDNLFYSRRIGRSPQGSVSVSDGEYVDMPERTTILAAVKFSGKTESGLSIGVMESVTSSEYAHIKSAEKAKKVRVEPMTNYFVARVQKDFNNKNTFLGGIVTSTYRDLNSNVDFLHKTALTSGIDFLHQWDNRSWYFGTNLVFSQVNGSKESILNTQSSIRHLYQRVDATHVKLDSNRTSLSGHGGDIKIGKAGNGHIKFETGLTWRSPGLELNDIGFMREADEIQNYFGMTYNALKPFSIFRTANIGYNHWSIWDFEGNHNYFDWDIVATGTFKNNWTALFGYYEQFNIHSKSLLRGGPRLRLPSQGGTWWNIASDNRKKFYVSQRGWTKGGGNDSFTLFETAFSLNYQPTNQFSVSLSPKYTTITDRLLYVDQLHYDNDSRYITAKADHETFSSSFRFNYTIASNISIQYYGEPFITTGKYSRFNYVVKPLARSQKDQLAFYSRQQLSQNETGTEYFVDEDQNETQDYGFKNPDFSFAQFRSNLVIRYEYHPGSELFFIWSQGITDDSTPRKNLANSFSEQIFSKQINNTFLVKLTYRFIK